MQVRVITLRYSDSLQGFPEEALRQATAGATVIEAREHFFVHGGMPHLTVVLLLDRADTRPAIRDDPGADLPESLRPLYRDLGQWRNARAKTDSIPNYAADSGVEARTGSTVAARGTTSRPTAVRRTATGTRRATATTTWAVAS